ncbi:MAG: PTS sugar transporter subunit IIA [bacterium]|nr:PTS sugar transporter subunit IIA [bacterium]
MLLQELIDEELINCNLTGKNRDAVIEELVELFIKKEIIKDKGEFITGIKKREEIESTAIGDGIAIPHGRSDSVKKLMIAFGRTAQGVNFNAVDKNPVHLIFMIAAPVEMRKEYLQAVAKVARLLKSKIMRDALLKSENPKDVMKVIRDFDGVVPEKLKVKIKKGRIIHRK